MVICHCLAINDRMINALGLGSGTTVDDVVALCGAGGKCGGCRDSIEMILESGIRSTKVELAALRS